MNVRNSFSLVPAILRRTWLQILLLILILGGHVGLEFIPKVREHGSVPHALSFLAVWIVAWALARSLTVIRESAAITGRLAPNLQGLLFGAVRVVLYVTAFLIALDTIGISITPLIASLGVGSIAIGLALQDTLGNLFSGAYLYLDRPVAVGDWLRLDGGLEGQVTRIGWRTTRVLSGENMVVIPNSKLSSSVITNLSAPGPEVPATVEVGVAKGSDLEKVERVAIEVASALGSARIASGAQPTARFLGFGESSVQLSLTIRVRSFSDLAGVRHELIKGLHARFLREGIELALPRRLIRNLE